MNITRREYTNELNSIALELSKEALKQCDNDKEDALNLIYDTLLHETVDGHQWVIYTAYNLSVIEHTNNENYMLDNLGKDCLAHSLEKGGVNGLHCAIAFWALYADISDIITSVFYDYYDEITED